MNINTTHNVDDFVFLILNKKIRRGTILEINKDIFSGKPIVYYVVRLADGKIGDVYGNLLFKTREKAEEYLNFKLNTNINNL